MTGRQIGKTTAAVNELIKRSLIKSNSRNWYVTNDYRQAKRNVWDEIKKYIVPEMGAKLNDSELKVMFPNGSKIELIGVENAESLRGAVVDFMILDEYADFPREVFPKVLRPMLTTTGGGVWFIGTPKGLGNDLYDRYNEGVSEHTSVYKMPSCTIVEGKITDTLSKYASIPEIQSAYDSLPKDAFEQEYMAEFTRPSGTVYSDWPLDNFRKVEYENDLPIHISMDFGVNDPTSIIWIQKMGAEIRIIDYYEASNANIEHFVSVIKSKPYKEAELYTADVAGNARTITTGTSAIDILNGKGIYVRTKGGVRIPDQIRVTNGYMKSLYVSDKLERFRDCLLNYRYPDVKESARNQENEIPIHDQYSHAMRALEYYFVNIIDFKDENIILPQYKPTFSRTGY